MTTLEIITNHVARLPEALRLELLHYALFLEQRFAKAGQTIEDPPEERQHLLAESLEAATRVNPFQEIPDPVAWQRDIRRDRSLPGRNDNLC